MLAWQGRIEVIWNCISNVAIVGKVGGRCNYGVVYAVYYAGVPARRPTVGLRRVQCAVSYMYENYLLAAPVHTTPSVPPSFVW